MKIYLVIFIFLLSACGGINQTEARKWEAVSCSTNKGWDACMSVAAKACLKGFYIRNQEEDMMTQKRIMQFSCR